MQMAFWIFGEESNLEKYLNIFYSSRQSWKLYAAFSYFSRRELSGHALTTPVPSEGINLHLSTFFHTSKSVCSAKGKGKGKGESLGNGNGWGGKSDGAKGIKESEKKCFG